MKKISLVLFFCLFFVIVQPVALSDDDSSLDGNEVCGILSVILIIVVFIIGIFFFISDSKNKKKGKIKKDEKPSKFCPNCGREVSFDTKFCQYCGWKIN